MEGSEKKAQTISGNRQTKRKIYRCDVAAQFKNCAGKGMVEKAHWNGTNNRRNQPDIDGSERP